MHHEDLRQELQQCYSAQAVHFGHTRKKYRPEMDHITTYLQDIEATPQSPIHILELGCGTGRSLDIFQDMYGEHFHYIGNDVASGMIIQAKKTYGGRNRREASSATRQWHTGSMLEALRALPDDSQDVVISIASLQHLMNPHERALVLAHSYRVLRYGGHIISVNRSFSYWFLQNYRQAYGRSLIHTCLPPRNQSRNDIIIPWKDPQRQENKRIWKRYYHIFTRYELQQYMQHAGFITQGLGYVLQDGSWSDTNRKRSRNTLVIGKKDIR